MAVLLGLVEAYGTAEQVVQIVNDARERISHALHNPERGQLLIERLQRFSRELEQLKIAYDNNALNISNDKLDFYNVRIQSLKENFQDMLQSLNKKISRLKCVLYRVTRANSTAEWFSELESDARKIDELLREIMSVVTVIDVVRNEVKGLKDHTTATTKEQTETLIDVIQGGSEAARDVFCPSFDVPHNPPHVVLHFPPASFVKEEPFDTLTTEAKLKAAVLRQLRDASSNVESKISSIVGVEGMSGLGKTCALRGLATDPDVCKHFKHGLYYISLGKDATPTNVIQEIAKIVAVSGGLGRSRDICRYVKVDAAVSLAQKWFKHKHILLLIDDVWQQNDIQGDLMATLSRLIDTAVGSRMVFTTRDKNLTNGSSEVHFSTKDSDVSLQILLAAADLRQADIEPFQVKVADVLKMCGGHPLALAIAGSTIKGLVKADSPAGGELESVWDEYSSELQRNRNTLLNSPMVNDPYKTLQAAFSASLLVLDKKVKPHVSSALTFSEMYRRLVVLPSQGWIPLHVLQILWDMSDLYKAKQVLLSLENANLIRREYRVLNGKKSMGLSIHDLQLDFVRNECERNGEPGKWDQKLVKSFCSEAGSNESHSYDTSRDLCFRKTCQDEYMRNNIGRHMWNGGLLEELYVLLTNPQWIFGRLCAHEILGLEEDIGMLLSSTGQQSMDLESDNHDGWALKMIAEAARLSFGYVAENPREVCFQLYARLLPLSDRSVVIKRFMKDIERYAERPWVKALTACLASPGGALDTAVVCVGTVHCISGMDADGKFFVCGTQWVHNVSHAFISTIKNGLIEGTVWFSTENQGSSAATDEDDTSFESNYVVTVCCTSDGKRVLTVHQDGTVQIWNAATGEAIEDAKYRHNCPVGCASWSPDGTRTAVGSDDGTVLVWDGDGKRLLCDGLRVHPDEVVGIAWTRDGTKMATGSIDGTILIWNVETGAVEGDALRFDNDCGMYFMDWSPNFNRLAIGSPRGLYVWDFKDETNEWRKLNNKSVNIMCLAWSPEGRRLAYGTDDGRVCQWDAETEAVVIQWETNGIVACIKWSCDGRFVASVSSGVPLLTTEPSTVRLWRAASGTSISTVLGGSRHRASVVKLSQDGKRVTTGDPFTIQYVWDTETLECLREVRIDEYNYTPDDDLVDLLDDIDAEVEHPNVQFHNKPGRILHGSEDEGKSSLLVLATLEGEAYWSYSAASRKIAAVQTLTTSNTVDLFALIE